MRKHRARIQPEARRAGRQRRSAGRAGRWLAAVLLGVTAAWRLAAASPWPEAVSDLKPDPAVVWGALPNGLRYAILPNAEPKERISLRLLVAAGSLLENDDEAGIAHFVEHMAFRGTRTHPGGSLTSALERIGIAMGPDSTAFTNYDYVIYHLELPNAQEAVLRSGLQAFREYAEEATFDPALIERERGVILNEMAMRANAGFYLSCANTQFLWPNSRRATRIPIGSAASVQHCTRERLVAFYDAWYRPERMAVLVVGSVKPDAAARLIAEVFGGMQDRGPPRAAPANLDPPAASQPDLQAYADASQTGVTFFFQHPQPWPRAPDTHARRVEQLHRALAFAMLQSRVEKFARKFPGTFVDPHAGLDYDVPGWQTAYLIAGSKVTDGLQAVTDLEKEHRRAFLQGFTEPELKVAKANLALAYDEAVRSAASRQSPALAAELAGCLLYGRVLSTPDEIRRDLNDNLQAATVRQCIDAFRAAWSTAAPHVFVATNSEVTIWVQRLAEALNKSRKAAAEDRIGTPRMDFAYAEFGAPGTLVHDEQVADLDIHLAAFANGVRLNFKPTVFASDGVEIVVRVGSGKLSQPQSQPGLGLLAGATLLAGGLGKHERQDIDDLLAGHAMQIRFDVDADAVVFTGSCARRDLMMTMQLVTAYLTDPAFRPAAMTSARLQFSSMYASYAESPGGPILQKAERILAGGDRRFGVPEYEDLYSRDLPSVRAWLEPQFKSGPIEIGVVGDVSWEEVRDAAAKTLGALPARQTRPPPGPEGQPQFPPLVENRFSFKTPSRLQQVAIAWAWPVTDAPDRHAERRCRLLAAAIAERLRVQVREQLGASYAPTAEFVHPKGFPAFGYFWVYLEVLPKQTKPAAETAWKAMQDLRKKRMSQDEFDRLRQPMLRALEDETRTNAYWLTAVVSDAQQRPDNLAAARDRAADYASIKPADLEKLAKRYLDPARVYIFAAVPER